MCRPTSDGLMGRYVASAAPRRRVARSASPIWGTTDGARSSDGEERVDRVAGRWSRVACRCLAAGRLVAERLRSGVATRTTPGPGPTPGPPGTRPVRRRPVAVLRRRHGRPTTARRRSPTRWAARPSVWSWSRTAARSSRSTGADGEVARWPSRPSARTPIGCPRAMVEVAPDPALDPGDAHLRVRRHRVAGAGPDDDAGPTSCRRAGSAPTAVSGSCRWTVTTGEPSCVVRGTAGCRAARGPVRGLDRRLRVAPGGVPARRRRASASRSTATVGPGGRRDRVGEPASGRSGSARPGVGDEDDQFHGRIDDVFLRIDAGLSRRRQAGRATQSEASSSANVLLGLAAERPRAVRRVHAGVEVRHRHDVVASGRTRPRRAATPPRARVRRGPRGSRTRRSPAGCRRTSRITSSTLLPKLRHSLPLVGDHGL